jgi:hypothetical protein
MEMEHTHVVMQLLFENTQFASIANSIATSDMWIQKKSLNLPIRSEIFFELFPFHVVFKRNMEIVSIGESLKQAMKNAEHENVSDVFNLVRPLMTFNWQNVSVVFFFFFVFINSTKNYEKTKTKMQITGHTNNVFELATIEPVKRPDTAASNGRGNIDFFYLA